MQCIITWLMASLKRSNNNLPLFHYRVQLIINNKKKRGMGGSGVQRRRGALGNSNCIQPKHFRDSKFWEVERGGGILGKQGKGEEKVRWIM